MIKKERKKLYFEIWGIDTPKDERKKYHIGDIFKNQAKCLLCDEIIISENRHHYNTCKCGNLSVDGGSWYLKRSVKNNDLSSYKELSRYYKDTEI